MGHIDLEQQKHLARLMERDRGLRGKNAVGAPKLNDTASTFMEAAISFWLTPTRLWMGFYERALMPSSSDSFSLLSDARGMDRLGRVEIPKEKFFQYLERKGDYASHMLLGASLQMLLEEKKIDDETMGQWFATGVIPDEVQDMLLQSSRVKQMIDAGSSMFTSVQATPERWEQQMNLVQFEDETPQFFQQMHRLRSTANREFPDPQLSIEQEEAVERMLGIFNAMVAHHLGDLHMEKQAVIR